MGTRGLTGFILDGTEYVTYQQYDAYPDHTGVRFLEFAAGQEDLTFLKALVGALVLVKESDEPNAEQLKQLGGRYHQQVSSGKDWYAHLRATQGNWGLMLESGFMTDHGGEAARQPDDIWIEYSYILDLDKGELRAYAGNLASPAVGAWPLDALPTNVELLAAFGQQ